MIAMLGWAFMAAAGHLAAVRQVQYVENPNYNFTTGDHAGDGITSGTYDLCVGEGSCAGVTSQDCVIDVTDAGALDELVAHSYKVVTRDWGDVDDAIHAKLLPEIEHCPYDKRREQIADYLRRMEVPNA
jgi:hypothetical protein